MNFPDAYETLGVPRDAPASDIRRAYRRLALSHHPDHNPDDPQAETRFKEIVLAYETLRDPKKRAAYDAGRGPGQKAGGYDEAWEAIFSQIFQRARSEQSEKAAKEERRDLHTQITIRLEEAATGVEREVSVQRWSRCSRCAGRGTDPGARPVKCRLCGGSGEIHFKRGLAEVAIPCHTCQGEGVHVREKCPECKGAGRRRLKERLMVKVPAAVESGTQLKVRGKGDDSARLGETGDLFVTVRIAPHSLFQREGNDLLFELPITFSQAALGDEVFVPTLDGQVKVRIPAGTQTGQVFRLRGKGLSPAGGRGAGDQLVKVVVETPIRLNKKLRRLLEEFQKSARDSAYPLRKRFLDKLRSFLRG